MSSGDSEKVCSGILQKGFGDKRKGNVENSFTLYMLNNSHLLFSAKNRYFVKQFELADRMKLPMFLHMRAAASDFCHILEQNKER